MFIAFYKEYKHSRNRDNYDTMEITDSGSLADETLESLLNAMFQLNERHRKSEKSKDGFPYEYTSIEWSGLHEVDLKKTYYQEGDFAINWDYDGNTSEKELLKMIANSEAGKKAAKEKETKRKKQAEKRKLENETRKRKKIAKKQKDFEINEQHDKDEYQRLKLKFKGDTK